jgi:hypothetical protein
LARASVPDDGEPVTAIRDAHRKPLGPCLRVITRLGGPGPNRPSPQICPKEKTTRTDRRVAAFADIQATRTEQDALSPQAKIDFKFNPLTACELRMRVSTNHTPDFHPAETAKVNTLESNRVITTLGSGRTYGFNATIPVSYGLFIEGRVSAWYSGRRFGQRC